MPKRDGNPSKTAPAGGADVEAAEQASFLYAELREYVHKRGKPHVQKAILKSCAERLHLIGGFVLSRMNQ